MKKLTGMVLVSLLMSCIYVAIWKITGFEYAVCCGIGQIIASITLKE